jgi:hypothetical protein
LGLLRVVPILLCVRHKRGLGSDLKHPQLAESGLSDSSISDELNVRFREKRTFNMKRNRLVPRQSGHQMGTWDVFEAV